jgi:hypothetical protein
LDDERVIEIELTVLKRHANRLRLLYKQRERHFPDKGDTTLLRKVGTNLLNYKASYLRGRLSPTTQQ